MVKVITQPAVTLMSYPTFVEPEHLRVDFLPPIAALPGEPTGLPFSFDQTTGAELLCEYAGRICYMSQANPLERTTAEYNKHILEVGHGSIMEHANVTLLLEGISRSCSHEIVRHRAGFAYSQLSQRYVDESDCQFVVPPLILDAPEDFDQWEKDVEREQHMYIRAVERCMALVPSHFKGTDRRKAAREAARSLLPNATETKIVMTGNARAWRHFLTMRGAAGADAEIRRLALVCFDALRPVLGSLLQDFVKERNAQGILELKPGHAKV